MSLIATLALAASGLTLPQCSWDRPGVNPFMGDVVQAIDDYKDIPESTRLKLKKRMSERQYEDMVTIRRDSIEGKSEYGSEIRDMHYGASGNVCRTVTRKKWTAEHAERGLVYCEDNQCIVVPTVCRNVSRIRRLPPRPVAALPTQAENIIAAKTDAEEPPLLIDPPAAGVIDSLPSTRNSFAQVANLPTETGTTSFTPSPPPAAPPLPSGSVTPVPEPQVWLMFLAGLVAMGFKLRRARP
jgi:hypothetical protein